MRFWKDEIEHSQFSNSRRVSFCLASVDIRDWRLLIVVTDVDDGGDFVVVVQPLTLAGGQCFAQIGEGYHVEVVGSVQSRRAARHEHDEPPQALTAFAQHVTRGRHVARVQ